MTPWVRADESASLFTQALPLERYFPPYQEGMVRNWLSAYANPGDYLLDPFGQNPFTSLELARAGFRVLVSANNPIAAFVLRVLASAPSAELINSALLQLSQNRMRDDSTIEEAIMRLYSFPCPNPLCNKSGVFEVESFIWAENAQKPHLAIGRCSKCDLQGEVELTQSIQEALVKTPSYALTRSQILEKVAGQDLNFRRVIEEVMSFYTPRALVSLNLLLTKIESSKLSPEQENILKALWLTAADQSNQLWAYPIGKNRPKQLLRPPQFQEMNVWKAFIRSVKLWQTENEEVKCREWPKRLPPGGGISLFEGRLRELPKLPEAGLIKAVQSSIPRRNQAWWNLSGLWSGWLWGKEGVKTLKNSLLKQRYDWTWHSHALKKVLSLLPNLVSQETPILLMTGELDSLYLIAAMLGPNNAGLKLESISLDGEMETLQTCWKLPTITKASLNARPPEHSIQESGAALLNQLGEPSHWLRLFTYALADQICLGKLNDRPHEGEMLKEIAGDFAKALNDLSIFQRYNPGSSPESGFYWLAKPADNTAGMADRAEEIVLRSLRHNSELSQQEIYTQLYEKLPGLLTPSDELVQNILESYAKAEQREKAIFYCLNERETEIKRKEDLSEMQNLLISLAKKLSFEVEQLPERLSWLNRDGSVLFSFFPITTAEVSQAIKGNQSLPGQKFIILPASRSNLISYKLKRDQNLRMLKGENWHLVKFRQIRNLFTNPNLSRENFLKLIMEDPPEFLSSQLSLF